MLTRQDEKMMTKINAIRFHFLANKIYQNFEGVFMSNRNMKFLTRSFYHETLMEY